MKKIDLVIIGGGPAGMSAAVKAREQGISDILILDRDTRLGGILQQCIHNGFGLHRFKEELTGPEYSYKYEQKVADMKIPFMLNTMVMDISKERVVTAVNEKEGIFQIKAGAIILAMGCRERSRGALNIPGTRPAGVYTAGTAQRFMNVKGLMPGKKVVILGSGDIGLIMARRMTLEGASVKMVCELMPYSGGLTRNIVQCLNDFQIPLRLSHTITQIHGDSRLEGVTVAAVDANKKIIPGTEEFVACDTLLLSVGLIPENELSKCAGVAMDGVTSGPIVDQNRQTSIPGIFACGNVLHVHDLVDFVSEEAELAGTAAAEFLGTAAATGNCFENAEAADFGTTRTAAIDAAADFRTTRAAAGVTTLTGRGAGTFDGDISLRPAGHVRYVVPQKIEAGLFKNPESELSSVTLYFRVDNIYKNVEVGLMSGGEVIASRRRGKVAPGEMETFTLTAAHLSKVVNGEIEVFVREGR